MYFKYVSQLCITNNVKGDGAWLGAHFLSPLGTFIWQPNLIFISREHSLTTRSVSRLLHWIMTSTLDINKVITSLGSSKTKDRTDALTLLESISNSKFKLTAKQFRAIVQGIFELISHESRIHKNNKSTLVEMRMARAANSLRIMNEKAIDDPKLSLKYKSYLELVVQSMQNFYDALGQFTPCSMDFIFIINRIVSLGFFKEHLTKIEWNKIFTFLKKVILQVINLNETTLETNSNEKLLIELFGAMHNLLQCNNSVSISYLQLLDNYFDTLSLIKQTVKFYKKENLLIIILFKIINKLIIILSTQDFKFVKKLAEIGLNLFLKHYQTSWESLHYQFLIFLNLPATHDFLNLEHLPKLIGDSADILTIDEAETSIRSPPQSSMTPLMYSGDISESSREFLLYSIKILIESLIGRMNSNSFKFESDDISLIHTTNHKKTWFKLKSIYLSSENYKPWLLSSGVSKLIVTYFRLKEITGDRSLELETSGLPKRQKLGLLNDALRDSHTILEFCNRLLNCKSEVGIQEVGLQLLVFHLETYSSQEASSPAGLQLDNWFDTTNISFSFDKNVLFQNVLSTFDTNDLNYWSLIVINSLTNDYILSNGDKLQAKYFFQMLKIALQLLKHKELSSLACNLVFNIVYCNSNEDLARLIDKSIITQLDNLIDLSEINGPYTISNESFQLWYSIHKVVKDINSQKRFILVAKIQDWIVSKWGTTFNLNTRDLLYLNSGLPEFLSWLCQIQVNYVVPKYTPNLYKGTLNEIFLFQDSFQQLERFVILETGAAESFKEKMIEIESLGENKRGEDLLSRCVGSVQLSNNDDSNPLLALEWALMAQRIGQYLGRSTKYDRIIGALRYQFTSVIETFRESSFSTHQILSFVEVLTKIDFLGSDPLTISAISDFPFAKFISHLRRSFKPERSFVKQDAMDLEFGKNETKQKTELLTQLQLRDENLPCIYSIKLLVLFNNLLERNINVQISSLVEHLEPFDSTNILYSVNFIIEEFEGVSILSISTHTVSKLVRIAGERLLSEHAIERNELTLITISKLMSWLLPLFISSPEDDFTKDCFDMCRWLIQCGEQGLIVTEASSTAFVKFLIDYVRVNDQVIIDTKQIKSIILEYFDSMPNISKVNLVQSFVSLISGLSSANQASWYNALFERFKTPEQSIESSATYTVFFNYLSRSSPQILLSSLFNLLEFTRFPFFVPYLEATLTSFCEFMNISGPQELFKALKFEIFRCWMKFDTISNFPFALFDYSDLNKFIGENYKELVAILIASKNKNSNYDKSLLITISQIKNSTVEALISESLPLIVGLSFTSDGVRNDVFDTLLGYLKDSLKLEFKAKLGIIVLEIIKYTDLSKESEMLKNFGNSKLILGKVIESSNSKVLERHGEASISLNTSLELMRKLVGKYSKDVEFWSTTQVYFLLRRLSLLFKNCINLDQRIVLIRKMKLVLLLGSEKLDFDVCRIIIHIICPLLLEESLRGELFTFIHSIDIELFSRYSDSLTIPLVIKLLAILLEIKSDNMSILSLIEIYIKQLNQTRSIVPVLACAVHVLIGRPMLMSTSIFDQLLDDEKEMEVCLETPGLWRLISSVFPFLRLEKPRTYTSTTAKILLQAHSETFLSQSTAFNSWSAQYLASFYLKGDFESNEFLQLEEYHDLNGDDFEFQIKFMDKTLSQIVDHLEDDDWEVAACAETILGALIYMFQRSPGDLLKFVNFRNDEYSSYILPLDFHSCILLNDDAEVDFLGDNIEHVIKNLDTLVLTESFTLWTTKLLLALLQEIAKDSCIAALFSSFVIKVPSFAQEALPFFVSYYIHLKNEEGVRVISSLIVEFTKLQIPKTEAIELFIRILLLIRIGAKKALPDFAKVIIAIDMEAFYKLAAHTKLYKTAFLLFEDWKSTLIDQSITIDDAKTLSAIYLSIDDDDLVYGLPAETSVEYALNSIGQMWSADQLKFDSATFDAQLSLNSKVKDSKILQSMLRGGLIGVLSLISKSVGLTEESYEWAWKLNRWELPIPRNAIGEHEVIYKALKQIHDYPKRALSICKDIALEVLINKDLIVNAGSSKELRKNTTNWVRTIAAISSVENLLSCNNLCETIEEFNANTSWIESSDIVQAESILLARQVTFQLMSEFLYDFSSEDSPRIFPPNDIWLGVINELTRFNNLARFSKELQKMVSSTIFIDEIAKSKFTNDISKEIGNLSRYQAARTLWAQGQTSIPVAMLKDIAKDGNIELPLSNLSVDRSLISANLVGWMTTSRQELASKLMEEYVLPTAASASLKHLDQQAEVYRLLGHFCEEQYKSRNLTEEISKLDKMVSEKKQEVEELKSHYGKTSVPTQEKKAVQRFYSKLKNQIAAESTDLALMKSNKERFSSKAVEFYLKSIIVEANGDNDESLDKFFALWLEQLSHEELNSHLQKDIYSLPSYKFVSWCTQLISRLSSELTAFQVILQSLLMNLCLDHPYQTLYQLISLRKHETSANSNPIMAAKYSTASKIWRQLLSLEKKYVEKVLLPIELFCNEAIKLALTKLSRGKGIYLNKIDSAQFWMHELPSIPPPTKDLPIDNTTEYKNVPRLVLVDLKVVIAMSGLSLPKIARFALSNGEEHKMLFKSGTDDLRQDSIMEQVFEKVNHIFAKDRESRKRRLNIRTYKAIPLGPNCGIIEYVPNSIAFIDVVKPYHSKYDKIKVEKARDMMKQCQGGDKTVRQKVFEEVITKIGPVLHYFFSENFVTPDVWFQSRISYTHGMATNSMLGHVLGLGDRHCNNILLDKNSGEPIHIDLGVAFDQGRRLPIPETVPFRLTRDIVDGFGCSGVEGVFKKSCEHTFRVLRSNKDHILSILDVLRWDPLYSWTLSPIRKKKLQEEVAAVGHLMPQEEGSDAGRAVLMVRDKLIAGGLSNEAAVRELVNEATSVENLALIYFGWSPFY